MTLALKISDLSITYPLRDQEVRAVDRVSLEIPEGEFFALLGPNGAGKTSLISFIAGIQRAQSGSAHIFDHPVGSLEAKRLLGLLPQEIVNHGFFSVEQVLRFYSGYYGIKNNEARIRDLLQQLELFDHRHKKVSQLSGGMKRRFLLAKSLLHSPRLLLLDEPSAGVDVELRQKLWEFSQELNAQGVTIILTTHYLEEAESLCKRVGIIHHGKLVTVGETKSLISQLSERTVTFTMRQATALPSTGLGQKLRLLDQTGTRFRVAMPASFAVGDLIQQLKISPSEIVDLTIEEGALEDVFRRFTAERSASERSGGAS